MTNDNTEQENIKRDIYFTNFLKALNSTAPLVFPQKNGGQSANTRHCDVFDSLHKISGFPLIMLVSLNDSESDESYNLLHFRENTLTKLVKKFFPNETTASKSFHKFMEIVRERIEESKKIAVQRHECQIYDDYSSFAAFQPKEQVKIKSEEKAKGIHEVYSDICSEIKDIVVYEHPFTQIVSSNCSFLYFVLVDTNSPCLENDRERQLEISSMFFRFIAEINGNVWMKKRVEDLPIKERVQEIKKTGTRESYHRSVKKLAAMQRFENFGKMIDTLVAIQFHETNWENYDPAESLEEFKERIKGLIDEKIVEFYLAQFEFTSENKNLFDTKLLSDKRVGERKEMIELMWKTSLILCEVDRLSNYYHGKKNSKESNLKGIDSKDAADMLEGYMKMTLELLRDVPKNIWNAEIEWSTKNGDLLDMKPQVLVLFFLTKLTEWYEGGHIQKKTLFGGGEGKGDCEKIMYLKHLLHAIQFVLYIRDKDDVEVLRSIIWLISEFGHEALGIPRRLDLENIIFLLAQQQAALFGLKDHYRDHLNHVIQVCLTGWVLLETKIGTEPLYQRFPALQKTSHEESKGDFKKLRDILAKWFVASLLHDVGYVLSIGEGWIKLLGTFGTESLKQVQDKVKEGYQNAVRQFLADRPLSDILSEVDYEDHGVISAIHVAEILYTIGSKEVAEYTSSLRALAYHAKSTDELTFASDPLAVLLILCDEIQEWGRPAVDRENLAFSMSLFSNKNTEYWYHAIDSVGININIECGGGETHNPIKISLAGASHLQCEIRYTKNIQRDNSIYQVWLSRSESLQRLNLAESPLAGMKFKLISDIRENHHVHDFRKKEKQMERLKRFVRNERFWLLSPWLETVVYDKDVLDDKDVVELDIDSLQIVKPVQFKLSEFWRKFSEWKDIENR